MAPFSGALWPRVPANRGEKGQPRERSCVEGWMQEEGRRVEKEQEVEAQTRGWTPGFGRAGMPRYVSQWFPFLA